VRRYEQAEAYVNGLILGPPSPAPGTPPEEIRARAVARLTRLRAFLDYLGNPQLRYRTIHITGTSGKGSTSVLTAAILRAAGLRVGCHVSPYLQVATEKLQIDGELIPAARYEQLVAAMRARVEAWVAAGHERPNYGEFWVAMTFQYFADERVDVAVIEVGAGGRFDVTNVIEPEVAAITSVGYDHMATLGTTLPEIAWHKAGIIKPGARAVTAVTDPQTISVIEAEAHAVGAPLTYVRPDESYREVVSDWRGTAFTDVASGRRFVTQLPGRFQAANAAMASAICRAFDPALVSDDAIVAGLAAARFPGRMELVQRSPLVVLDGAHNPEKVSSLVRELEPLFPGRRVVLVFGVLESKSHAEMLAQLLPHVQALVATAPRVLAKPPVSAADVAAQAPDGLLAQIEPDPLRAVETALQLAGPDDVVLVTGSLYLVGNVRERWDPSAAILEQGTCWPAAGWRGTTSPPGPLSREERGS
jgi:dihydrofolate synthase/folylpolyglutamate synthase